MADLKGALSRLPLRSWVKVAAHPQQRIHARPLRGIKSVGLALSSPCPCTGVRLFRAVFAVMPYRLLLRSRLIVDVARPSAGGISR